MLSIKLRQRAGEKGVMFKLVKSRFSEVHCETLGNLKTTTKFTTTTSVDWE